MEQESVQKFRGPTTFKEVLIGANNPVKGNGVLEQARGSPSFKNDAGHGQNTEGLPEEKLIIDVLD